MLPPTPTQLYLVSIRFRRKISFDTSFTISNLLKKYYCIQEIFVLFRFKDFWYTKIFLTQICIEKFLHKQHEFLVINYIRQTKS